MSVFVCPKAWRLAPSPTEVGETPAEPLALGAAGLLTPLSPQAIATAIAVTKPSRPRTSTALARWILA